MGKHFTDLTAIDVPFGELDQVTQWVLRGAWAAGERLEWLGPVFGEWLPIPAPGWHYLSVYRLAPTPVEETITHDMQISAHGNNQPPSVSTCDQTGSGWINGTLTLKTVDGKAVSATWVAK